MCTLIFGKNNQVEFSSLQEKTEAMKFLITSPNVSLTVENNDDYGAYAPEHRIHVRDISSAPSGVIRNLTNGNRINCKDLFEIIEPIRTAFQNSVIR